MFVNFHHMAWNIVGVDKCQLLFSDAHGRQDPCHVLNLFSTTLLKPYIWVWNEGIIKIVNKDYQSPWNISSLALIAQGNSTKASGPNEKELPENNQKIFILPTYKQTWSFLPWWKAKSSDPFHILKEKGKYQRSQRASM